MNKIKTALFALTTLTSTLTSTIVFAKDKLSICWSTYIGSMPWNDGDSSFIVKKWANKDDIEINIVHINDYTESINQYTADQFNACVITNMHALTIPAASFDDTKTLIIENFSDDVVLKRKTSLLSEIISRPNLKKAIHSSDTSGEIIELFALNTNALKESYTLSKALVAA